MNADEAISILEKGETDFVILDINIKGTKNGIWIAEQINEKYKIPFIFLTALSDSDTVKTAARTKPYGYLVKPFKQADIFTTIEIALINFNENRTANRPSELEKIESEIRIFDVIFVKSNDVFKKIYIKDIQYIEAFKNYLELHVADSRYIIRSTLADFQKSLPQDHFMQTHRSYIININFLEKIGGNFVQLGKTEIPISRGFKESVLKKLKLYN
jgi:DNA-binding LytR/AlgR family response regulator